MSYNNSLHEKFASLEGEELEKFRRTAPLNEVMAYADWELAEGAKKRAAEEEKNNPSPSIGVPLLRMTKKVPLYYDKQGRPIKGPMTTVADTTRG